MLALMHSGQNGWIKLSGVSWSERAIAASADINFANHPKLQIDRMTSGITITGQLATYRGECRKVDPLSKRPEL
jgi:hypothetical protein